MVKPNLLSNRITKRSPLSGYNDNNKTMKINITQRQSPLASDFAVTSAAAVPTQKLFTQSFCFKHKKYYSFSWCPSCSFAI